jgi:hypothetical protein
MTRASEIAHAYRVDPDGAGHPDLVPAADALPAAADPSRRAVRGGAGLRVRVPATRDHDLALDETFAVLDRLGPAADRDTLLTFAGRGDEAVPAASRDRLRQIRAAYDPDGPISCR